MSHNKMPISFKTNKIKKADLFTQQTVFLLTVKQKFN